jgi:methylated-DNA-[protein]-cysteine S-methyltransferase
MWSQILMDYFAGEFDRLDQLPIQLHHGTVFQQAVWLALRRIAAGTTVSYFELAQMIGRPLAVRAVGQALKRNPLPIVLPCHRVIRQSGDLGGYNGQTDMGQSRKRFLLWHEGAYPQSSP